MKCICAAALATLLALSGGCSRSPDETQAAQQKSNTHVHEHGHEGSGQSANQPSHDPSHEPEKTDGMPGHKMDVKDNFNWDALTPPVSKGPAVDLKNKKDPVTLKAVAGSNVTFEYKGFTAHFESEQTLAKFKKKPLKFLNMLSLEPHEDGSVELVDAAKYVDCATEFCPVMTESEVDPHGTVYVLHRGFKIFFCCWSGCGDAFMKDPRKYYAWYSLVERDGKLVREQK